MGAVGQSKHFIFLIFMQYDILPTTISIYVSIVLMNL